MSHETMRARFVRVANDLLDSDPRVAIILADIGAGEFVTSAAGRRHARRVVNVGIREQLLISFAAGFALEGFRPIVHTYAPFLVERPLEQLKLDLGHQDVDAILVSVGASYDAAAAGRTHQTPEDVALVGALPGWQVHVPGHPDDVESLLRRAVSGGGRHYIRLAEDQSHTAREGAWDALLPIRKATAPDATVIAVGPMLDRVLAATNDLDVQVLHAITVRPFDRDGLRSTARSRSLVLVEPYLEGTSAADVAAALQDTPHRVLSIGVPKTEHRRYGSRHEHDRAHGLDAGGLHRRIADFIGAPERPPDGR